MNTTIKKLLPHLLAYAVLTVVCLVFFSPQVFEGKVLQQVDNLQSLGMQTEIREIAKDEGRFPLWTNSSFAGMPTYQILFKSGNALKYPFKALLWGNDMRPPHTNILLMMIGIYLLLVTLKIDWRIAVAGSIGFAFSANFMDQVLAGHSTKLVALAYMAPVLAGILLTFRGRYLLGGGMTALFLGLQIYANHLQITYYFLIMAGLLGLVYLGYAIKEKGIVRYLTAVGVLIIAAGLAFGTSASRLLTTYEYSKETIRGTSELSQKNSSSGSTAGDGGLSKDYAFGWSYGKMETFTLLIPNYVGGSSQEAFVSDPNSASLRALRQMNDPQAANQLAQLTSHYWGAQPFTGGPVYLGAVLILLFFLGAFLAKGPLRIWILIGTFLTLLMGLGENLPGFNYFLFDYFPLYNKFRAVTMVYGITSFLVVILAMLGLQAFISEKRSLAAKKKALFWAGGITAGLLVLGYVFSFGSDFGTAGQNIPDRLAAALQEDRAALLLADVFRSFIFVALTFAVLFLSLRINLKPTFTILAIGLLILIDMWGFARRLVSPDKFQRPAEISQLTQPSQADQQIMADPALYYRVADFRTNPFSSGLASFHHFSMGGYHAAKLMRYQELIEGYLGNPAANSKIYGMLNAKYFIGQGDQVQLNPDALGNAWFVQNYEIVPDGDAEYAALATLEPSQKAVVQQPYADYLLGLNLQYDSTANIRLTSYHPDTLVYQYSANSEQLAVFSEIYYPPSKGWDLYIDGEKAEPFIKANFTLRAARLPAGQNKEVKMVFAPQSYYSGEKISIATSWLVLLGSLGALVLFFRQGSLPDPDQLPEPKEVKAKPVKKAPKRKK